MAMKSWIKISLIILVILVVLSTLFLIVFRYGIASKLMSQSYNEAKTGNIGYAEFLMNIAVKLSPSQTVSFKLGLAIVLSEAGYTEDSTRITETLFSENPDIRGLLYMGYQFFRNWQYDLALRAYNESRFTEGQQNLQERAFLGYAKILIMQNKTDEVFPEVVRLSGQGVTPLIQTQAWELIKFVNK